MSIKFEDGSIVSYVRNSYQLNYRGVSYVNVEPDEPLDFAHNAKAKMQKNDTIQVLLGGKVFCELVPAKMFEISVDNHDQKAIFYEGADFVTHMDTRYYHKKPMVWYPSLITQGRFNEDGSLQIRVQLRRGSELYILRKEEQPKTVKRKKVEVEDEDSQERSVAKHDWSVDFPQ